MTKSQKKVFSKLKQELKKQNFDKELDDRIYWFIKSVEKTMIEEEQIAKERKKEKEEQDRDFAQLTLDDYDTNWDIKSKLKKKNK